LREQVLLKAKGQGLKAHLQSLDRDDEENEPW